MRVECCCACVRMRAGLQQCQVAWTCSRPCEFMFTCVRAWGWVRVWLREVLHVIRARRRRRSCARVTRGRRRWSPTSCSGTSRTRTRSEARARCRRRRARPCVVYTPPTSARGAGKKFDLRIYVLVASYTPLVVWLYRSGFGRFTFSRYSSDTTTMDNLYVHLTNVAIQKTSSECVRRCAHCLRVWAAHSTNANPCVLT